MKTLYYPFVAATIFFSSLSSHADSLTSKAANDDVEIVTPSNKALLNAYKLSRDSLPKFLLLFEQYHKQKDYFLKVGISDNDNNTEYFWVLLSQYSGGVFKGQIGNQPRLVKHVQQGQVISFTAKDIFDWMYMEDGKMIGNYTACAMLVGKSPDEQNEFQATYNLKCDFASLKE